MLEKTTAEAGMYTCCLSAIPQLAGSIMIILVYMSSLIKEYFQITNVNQVSISSLLFVEILYSFFLITKITCL